MRRKYQETRTKPLDCIATYDRDREQAKQNLMDTDYTMKLHKKVHNQEFNLREPQISSFYKPSVQQKQDEMIYVGEMTLALRLAASHFLWTIIKWKENFQGFIIVLKAFWRDCQLWRNWLKKPEFLSTLQSFGWWNRPSGRYICWLRSISRDQRFNLNVQMQFIKLIFFSFLMKRRPQGRGKSLSTHWQLLQADSRLPNLSPQKASSKVTQAFQTTFTEIRESLSYSIELWMNASPLSNICQEMKEGKRSTTDLVWSEDLQYR